MFSLGIFTIINDYINVYEISCSYILKKHTFTSEIMILVQNIVRNIKFIIKLIDIKNILSCLFKVIIFTNQKSIIIVEFIKLYMTLFNFVEENFEIGCFSNFYLEILAYLKVILNNYIKSFIIQNQKDKLEIFNCYVFIESNFRVANYLSNKCNKNYFNEVYEIITNGEVINLNDLEHVKMDLMSIDSEYNLKVIDNLIKIISDDENYHEMILDN